MTQVEIACKARGIRRLCHFTQSRNLAHIFDDPYGICSTKTLKEHEMPHNPTDTSRYDGREDLVCTSIEYPNTYYFSRVRENDLLFKDWVVLFIDPSHCWASDTHFCPCNAARAHGSYIQSGLSGFNSLFNETAQGPGFTITRSTNHLQQAPTDMQAEVLLKDPIPLTSITGIAVQSIDQAKQELVRFKLQGISFDKPIFIAPSFYEKASLAALIKSGKKPTETLYMDGDNNDQ
ncbi:MAG: DUF4433 domain-containing protein [Opitutaceae bacterium]